MTTKGTKMESYIDGTQRGYAYGLKNREGQRILEGYVHCKSWDAAGIDAAYREAKKRAHGLLETWKRRPGLVMQQAQPIGHANYYLLTVVDVEEVT